MASRKKTVEPSSNAITLNTVIFKDMVTRAKKGASNNSILPITSMMAIELKDNKLTLITTDSTNYLYVIQDNVEGPDFYVTVLADVFTQLISKTTSEKITLELKDNFLEVVGNGKYSIEIPSENGEIIKFPDPRNDVELEPTDNIKLSAITSIINTAKPSLAVTMENPEYTNYYCGEQVIATDTFMICCQDIKLWNTPRLISPQLMDLVALITAEDIEISTADDIILFSTPSCQVYGRTMAGLEDYSVEGITNLMNSTFQASCSVKKQDMLQLLDRLSLFVTKTDKNEVYLTFTEEGLQVSSKASSGVEVVKYVDNKGFQPFTCVIDIEMFTSEVKALKEDVINISYMNEPADEEQEGNTAIMFTEGDVKLLIALLADDRVTE